MTHFTGTEQLRISADAQTSKQELEKLGFNDWVSDNPQTTYSKCICDFTDNLFK